MPKSHRFYRAELDVLRCIAFLLVFVFHSVRASEYPPIVGAVTGAGAFGVQIFFVLSAFLITDLLFQEKRQKSTVDLPAFYARRVLRIWPLYILALTTAFTIGTVVPRVHTPGIALLANLLFVGNWYACRHGFLPLVTPLWTINLEEQFYLVWPSVVRFFTRRNVLVACICIWLTCQAYLFATAFSDLTYTPNVWANSLTQFPYFAIGAGLSAVLHGRTPALSRNLRALIGIVGLATLIGCSLYSGGQPARYTISVFIELLLVGAGVVLLFVSLLGATVHRIFRPLISMGKISYGLYVYHAPCILLMEIASKRIPFIDRHPHILIYGAPLPLTLLVSYLSYRFLEMPFLRLKRRFEVVRSREI